MKKLRSFFSSVLELLIKASGFTTSILVLIIIFFLFHEGIGIFTAEPLSPSYSVYVHPSNNVRTVEGETLRLLTVGEEKKMLNWIDAGGPDIPVKVITLKNVKRSAPDSVWQKSLTRTAAESDRILAMLAGRVVAVEPGALAILPRKNAPAGAKEIQVDNVSFSEFFFGEDWYPTSSPVPAFGILPIILGTLWVTFGAIVFALPLGIATAIYLSELADDRFRRLMKPAIELLAGIPSVVYGFFGLVIIVPMVQDMFGLQSGGETALAGSIILGIIALPTIITISEDAFKTTPVALKEASLALGATHWQTILKVIIPSSFTGISAAAILGIGRAVGETMAVVMVTGGAAVMPSSFLDSVRTLPATIASELGETAEDSTHYQALFMIGCVLFVITLVINLLVEYISSRSRFKKN